MTKAKLLAGKYDNVLVPFVAMMESELHANSGKGDRPGWLAMSREELLLEIYYHLAKLQKATLKRDDAGVREFSADVANMSMMMADLCGIMEQLHLERDSVQAALTTPLEATFTKIVDNCADQAKRRGT